VLSQLPLDSPNDIQLGALSDDARTVALGERDAKLMGEKAMYEIPWTVVLLDPVSGEKTTAAAVARLVSDRSRT
jgi:hypothetical protein